LEEFALFYLFIAAKNILVADGLVDDLVTRGVTNCLLMGERQNE
jgi:hypothetical protein